MSRARDRIVRVLAECSSDRTARQIEDLADRLMPIVRDTVAEGFDEAAAILNDLGPAYRTPVDLLRQWATDARAHNRPAED